MGLGLVVPAGSWCGCTLPAVLEARLYFARGAGAQAGRGTRVGRILVATGPAASILPGRVWELRGEPCRMLGEQGVEQGQRQPQGCRREPGCASAVGVPVGGPARSLQLLEGDGRLVGSCALQVRLHLRWGTGWAPAARGSPRAPYSPLSP